VSSRPIWSRGAIEAGSRGRKSPAHRKAHRPQGVSYQRPFSFWSGRRTGTVTPRASASRRAQAAAEARGQALGNPKLAEARAIANTNHTAVADAFADSVAPAIRQAQAAGAKTFRQIAAALNGRGIATARGGKWAPQAVANVLRRIR
jgi:hypothetical protein